MPVYNEALVFSFLFFSAEKAQPGFDFLFPPPSDPERKPKPQLLPSAKKPSLLPLCHTCISNICLSVFICISVEVASTPRVFIIFEEVSRKPKEHVLKKHVLLPRGY